MAIKNVESFEGQQATEAFATSGTFSFSTTVFKNGAASLRTNPATTAVGYYELRGIGADGAGTAFGSSNLHVGFWFRVDTLPATASEEILSFRNSTATQNGTVRITSTGALQLYAADGTTQIGSDTTVTLATQTWYYLRFRFVSSQSFLNQIFVNEQTVFEGAGAVGTGNIGTIRFGKATNQNGKSVDYYYDTIIISDITPFPSSLMVLHVKVPTANGATHEWTGGTNTSGFAEIDELVADGADYVAATADAKTSLFTIPTKVSGGYNGGIHAVKQTAWLREGTSATTTVSLRIRQSATNSDSSNLGLNATGTPFFKLLTTEIVDTAQPLRQETLDALSYGALCTTISTAVTIRMSELKITVVTLPNISIAAKRRRR